MNREQMIALLKQRGLEIPDTATDADLVRMLQESEPKPKINVEEHRAAGRKDEQTRVRAIAEAGRKYKKPELAQQAIEEGKTVEEFRQMLLDAVDGDNKAIIEGSSPIGLSEKEARSFSFVKLLRALSDPQNKGFREGAKFEIEACAAAAEQSHRAVRGTMIPVDVLMTPLVKRGDTVSVKSGAGYTGTGGNTVETRLLTSSFIDLLRNRAVLMQLGTELGGLVGDVDIPKQISGSNAAAWIGEDEDAPKDDIQFGIVQLRSHTLAVYGEITRKMLMQSSLGIEALVRADLARGMGLAVDLAGFYGDGLNNEPVGILETNGINTVDFAGVQPTFPEVVAMETAIAMDNADVQSMAYVANAQFRGHAKTTKKFADASIGTIWEPGGTVNGYRAEITNQITTGDVFFGNFADLLIAMWGGLDVTVDPYTHSTKGRIRIVNFQDFDFAVRRAASFCFGQKP